MERGEKTYHDLVTTFTRSMRLRNEQMSIGFAADLAQFISEVQDLIECNYEPKYHPQPVPVVPPPAPVQRATPAPVAERVCDQGKGEAAALGLSMPTASVTGVGGSDVPPGPVATLPKPSTLIAQRDSRIVQLCREGKTYKEISAEVGLCTSSIIKRLHTLRQLGVNAPKPRRPEWTEEQKQRSSEAMKRRLSEGTAPKRWHPLPTHTNLYPSAQSAPSTAPAPTQTPASDLPNQDAA